MSNRHEFKAGDEVPEWLVDVSPQGAGVMRFTVDAIAERGFTHEEPWSIFSRDPMARDQVLMYFDGSPESEGTITFNPGVYYLDNSRRPPGR